MDSASSKVLASVLVSLFLIVCVSADGYGYHPTQQDSRKNVSLRCYDCNSEFDPRCGDPFDPYTIGIVNCTDRRPPEQLLELAPDIQPKVCRKLVQKVEGKTRIIRGCGYLRDDRDDKECVIRSGTKDVHVKYCACTKSLCNSAHKYGPMSPLTAVIPIAVMLLCLNDAKNVELF
ncbi:uncharacterized protein LOC109599298 [Aethina tumida]|uniref:uncharacterized protein LOC109599298 n=1 Tax=Aethina tumida TaxID=116153 RepID=UPI00096B6104|nr:uncharacterized protein LOC109599298 [Aethina tumida]